MASHRRWKRRIRRLITHTVVAVAAVAVTYTLCWKEEEPPSKLEQLEKLLTECFIGQTNQVAIEDAAAAGMVDALGDRWSHYIPASEYDAHKEQMENAYVGIGISISREDTSGGIEILTVNPDGGAMEAGIQAGDVIIETDGKQINELSVDAFSELIRGEEGTKVSLTVLRGEQKLQFSVTRKHIEVAVAQGQMLKGDIGLVKINNFDDRCAEETIAAIEELVGQGAKALIFDVRGNPGGFKTELVKVLDYLLPEGPLFRSLYYTGKEEVDNSDAKHLDLPMAVLINGKSYSAAEFFAAALDEYDWAVLVGEPTVGKSYFQQTVRLDDGSAVALSVGKYTTPKGVSLADEGGLKPEIQVEVDKETGNKIYAGTLAPEEDPQIQAAIEALMPELAG